MQINNPLYKNIGIHIICSLFSVEKGRLKVLLKKEKEEIYKGMWSLVGGSMYNNETLEEAINREVLEKTNFKNLKFYLSGVESSIDRCDIKRMIAICYIGLINEKNNNINKRSDLSWFLFDEISDYFPFAYDHEIIFNQAKKALKDLLFQENILKELYPKTFTMPNMQRTVENILDKKLDRRNFRKKLLSYEVLEINKNYYKEYSFK